MLGSAAVSKLKELKELLDMGVLTQAEFDARKSKILSEDADAAPISPAHMQMERMQGEIAMIANMQQQAQPTRPQGYIPASWLEGDWTAPTDCGQVNFITVHADDGDDMFHMSMRSTQCGIPCVGRPAPWHRDESIGVVNVFRSSGTPVVRIKLVDENKIELGPQSGYPLFMHGPATKTSPTNHKGLAPQMMQRDDMGAMGVAVGANNARGPHSATDAVWC